MGRRLRWMPCLSQSGQVSAPLKFDHSLNASSCGCWYQRGPILVNVSAPCVVWSFGGPCGKIYNRFTNPTLKARAFRKSTLSALEYHCQRMGRCMQRPCAARPLESPPSPLAPATGAHGDRPPVESTTSAPPTPGRLRASTWRAPCLNRLTRRHLTQRRMTMPPAGSASTRSLHSSRRHALHPARSNRSLLTRRRMHSAGGLCLRASHHTCLIERRPTRRWLTVQRLIRLRLEVSDGLHEISGNY